MCVAFKYSVPQFLLLYLAQRAVLRIKCSMLKTVLLSTSYSRCSRELATYYVPPKWNLPEAACFCLLMAAAPVPVRVSECLVHSRRFSMRPCGLGKGPRFLLLLVLALSTVGWSDCVTLGSHL